MARERQNSPWRSFEIKVVFIVLAVMLTLSFCLYFFTYHQFYTMSIQDLKNQSENVFNYVDEIIGERSFYELNTQEDENKELYQSAHRLFDEIRTIANIRYLYTAKQTSDGRYIYLLDGLSPEAEDFRHVGEPIEDEIIPELKKCLDGEVITGDNIMVTEWGIVYVTYFPVYDAADNVIGAVGMEFDCEKLYHAFERARLITVVVSSLFLALFVIIVFVVLNRVFSRTKLRMAVEENRLIADKEEALENSKAKSEFLSRMSHEIRAPLNTIVGMAKISKNTDDKERLKYCLNTIGASSEQLLGIINDVLDMSKIEAGKLVLEQNPFNLEALLLKVCYLIVDEAERKSQQFTVSLGREMPVHFFGDELRLSQVITNLLSNAVKFTPNGGKIDLSAVETGRDAAYSTLRFVVSDTGIGMTYAQAGRIFQSFEQVGNSGKYGGTGLGLAITKNIVDMMGGKIWVDTTENVGSVFTIEVRLERENPESSPAQTCEKIVAASDYSEIRRLYQRVSGAAGTPVRTDIPDLSGVCILLVEDIEVNREIFIALLEKTGLHIECAANGLEAVNMFRQNPEKYDVIVMDIQMPVMDGFDATRNIRALENPAAKSVPIIAMTANAFIEDVAKCLESGMTDHLAKPIDEKAVMDKIRFYTKTRGF